MAVKSPVRISDRSLTQGFLFVPQEFAACKVHADPTDLIGISEKMITEFDHPPMMIFHELVVIDVLGTRGFQTDEFATDSVSGGNEDFSIVMDGRGNDRGSTRPG